MVLLQSFCHHLHELFTRFVVVKVGLIALLAHVCHIRYRHFGMGSIAFQHLLGFVVTQCHTHGCRIQVLGSIKLLCRLCQFLLLGTVKDSTIELFKQEYVEHIIGEFIGVFALFNQGIEGSRLRSVKHLHLVQQCLQLLLIINTIKE